MSDCGQVFIDTVQRPQPHRRLVSEALFHRDDSVIDNSQSRYMRHALKPQAPEVLSSGSGDGAPSVQQGCATLRRVQQQTPGYQAPSSSASCPEPSAPTLLQGELVGTHPCQSAQSGTQIRPIGGGWSIPRVYVVYSSPLSHGGREHMSFVTSRWQMGKCTPGTVIRQAQTRHHKASSTGPLIDTQTSSDVGPFQHRSVCHPQHSVASHHEN